jgi:imidazolonepropionase-like amidohydrolase
MKATLPAATRVAPDQERPEDRTMTIALRPASGRTLPTLALALTAAAAACMGTERVPGPAPVTPPIPATGTLDTATVAFVNVAVVPMDRERVLRDQTVVVRAGAIAEMDASSRLRPPAGATVIDGAGRYLMPGLAEMHAHIPSPDMGTETLERTLFLFLANGVTTIRGMLGHPAHLALRSEALRGDILAPRIFTSGPSFNGNSVPTPEIATRRVQEQHAEGYDFIKLHPGLSRPVFDATVAEARRVGIPLAGHVSADVGLDAALAARKASIDHLDGYIEALAGYGGGFDAQASGFFGTGLVDRVDLARIPEVAAATRAAGTWVVPTQSLMEHMLSPEDPTAMARRPEMRYMPPETVERWVEVKRTRMEGMAMTPDQVERFIDTRRRLILALQQAGAGLLLGADAPQFWNVPGFSIHHELRMLVDAGLTPYQALRSGTRNPAVYFGEEEWGTVGPGQVADLILVDDNPLEDVGNVARRAGVMVRGLWLPEAEIQARLDAIAAGLR